VHLDTVLGPVGDREAAGRRAADQLRAQIATLTSGLSRIDAELADLATMRGALRALAAIEVTVEGPAVISSACRQILAVLGGSAAGMRAEDVCVARDIEPLPKHVEGARAELKRLVSRNILTEDRPGIFTLIPKGA